MPRNIGPKAPRPVDVYVAARIRFRRNLLGLSQTEMAERIGVTFQQVQKYEKGANRIGASRLIRICDVLMVTPAWLFEGAPGGKPKTSATAQRLDAAWTAFQADDVAPRLVPIWPGLPARVKRSLVRLMSVVGSGARRAD
jgi:transcriptional regulator with XRE-family HTH domain